MVELTSGEKIEMQRTGLRALVRQGEPKFTSTWFPYTSGEVGPYYIQSVAIENDGGDYARAIADMCLLIEKQVGLDNFDVVGGGGTRDWDFSNPVAVALRKPHAKAYDAKKMIGASVKDKRVLWVADLNNEGSSMRDKWYPVVDKKGGEIVHAVFYVDRHEAGVQVMDELGLSNDAVIPFDGAAWQFLQEIGHIDQALRESLDVRMQDRKAWAHTALRNHVGQLEGMLRNEDPAIVAKGEKILVKGYPEIQDELLGLMAKGGYEHQLSS